MSIRVCLPQCQLNRASSTMIHFVWIGSFDQMMTHAGMVICRYRWRQRSVHTVSWLPDTLWLYTYHVALILRDDQTINADTITSSQRRPITDVAKMITRGTGTGSYLSQVRDKAHKEVFKLTTSKWPIFDLKEHANENCFRETLYQWRLQTISTRFSNNLNKW